MGNRQGKALKCPCCDTDMKRYRVSDGYIIACDLCGYAIRSGEEEIDNEVLQQ